MGALERQEAWTSPVRLETLKVKDGYSVTDYVHIKSHAIPRLPYEVTGVITQKGYAVGYELRRVGDVTGGRVEKKYEELMPAEKPQGQRKTAI